MRTITAKELRMNLDDVVQRALRGEEVQVTYRSKPAFTIRPIEAGSTEPVPGSAEAMQAFVAFIRGAANVAPPASEPGLQAPAKELYRRHLDEKYGTHDGS